MFECFSELISDEELADVTSFDDTRPSLASTREQDSGISIAKSEGYARNEVASVSTVDDDPDFVIPHRSSGTVHCLTKQRNVTIKTSGEASKSKRECGDTTDLQKKSQIEDKTSTNASHLASYLLQSIDSASAGCQTAHQGYRLPCVGETTSVDIDCKFCYELEDEFKGNRIEWFGLNSEEDLENFEHFDDESDFVT